MVLDDDPVCSEDTPMPAHGAATVQHATEKHQAVATVTALTEVPQVCSSKVLTCGVWST